MTVEAAAYTKSGEARAAWHRFKASRSGTVGLAILLALFACAILAPVIAPFDPLAISRDRLVAPSEVFWLGTDNLGKDVFSGLVYGARISLLIGLLAGAASLGIGLIVGAVAGYYGGAVDSALMRLAEFVQIMPRFFLAILVVASLGGGVEKTILVIGGLSWPEVARIVRAEFMSIKEREVVESARAVGFGDAHIIFREILPNAMPPAVVQASLDVSEAILLAAGLAFFGLSDPSFPSWGEMLNRAQPFLRTAWWMSIFPGMAIFLSVLAFNLVGDGLNDMLNPDRRDR
jgi:peptide/nickel transport system permease protein